MTNDILREYFLPTVRESMSGGPLIEMVARELAEKRRLDDEYLASLSDSRREAVLFDRRLKALEGRFRAALDFRPYYD